MRLKQKLWFALCCSIAANSSIAQIINIDKTDTSDYLKKAIWNGNLSLGLEVDKQKTTLADASNFFDVSLQQYKELFVFSASNRFTYDGGQSFLNTGYVHLRWRHNYKETLHPETYVQYQWDADRGMIHRLVMGENLRYNFWYHHNWQMAFATGVMYENELWDYRAVDSVKIPLDPVAQRTSAIKSNSYVKWEGKLSPVSDISVIVFYQAPFNDFLRPRVSLAVKFDVDISKHFSLNLAYSGLYDAKPVVPIFNFYYAFSNSLAYKF